jgi:hypothetical protein
LPVPEVLDCEGAWLHQEGQLKDVFKVQFLRTEGKVLAPLSPEQMARLIAFKPVGVNQTRTHIAALLVLDGGYRIWTHATAHTPGELSGWRVRRAGSGRCKQQD